MIYCLGLFNSVAKHAKPHFNEDAISDIFQEFKDTQLDSLDMLMICMYFSIIYGIDDETAKNMQPKNLKELHDFVMEHKTQEPTSIEEAMGMIK